MTDAPFAVTPPASGTPMVRFIAYASVADSSNRTNVYGPGCEVVKSNITPTWLNILKHEGKVEEFTAP